jgi:transposase InsO family protein
MAAVEYDGQAFCLAALDEALARFGTPDILNTDQGAQFTSAVFGWVTDRDGAYRYQTMHAVTR